MERLQNWVLKGALASLILAPITFLVAAFGYKFGLLDLGTSFGLLNRKVGPALFLLTGFLGLIGIGLFLLRKPRKGLVTSLAALLIPAAGMGYAANVKKTVDSLPFIHNISTDQINPPQFSKQIMAARGENSNAVAYVGIKDKRDKRLISELQSEAYPDIKAIRLDGSCEILLDKAKIVAKSLGWQFIEQDGQTLNFTDTTFWYGFKDDIAVRCIEDDSGSTLDLHSVSRVGLSDIGANANRIRAFSKPYIKP